MTSLRQPDGGKARTCYTFAMSDGLLKPAGYEDLLASPDHLVGEIIAGDPHSRPPRAPTAS